MLQDDETQRRIAAEAGGMNRYDFTCFDLLCGFPWFSPDTEEEEARVAVEADGIDRYERLCVELL